MISMKILKFFVVEENLMIRQAVGAIIRYQKNFILVHKVNIMDFANSPNLIKGEWDFVKGGMKTHENSKKLALFRELKEETGSIHYKILREYSEKLRFKLPIVPPQTGISHQETTMFLVEFLGDFADLNPEDQEIDKIAIFSKNEVYDILSYSESRNYFKERFF